MRVVSDPYRPGQYPSPDQTTRIPRVPSQQAPRRSPEPGKSKTREYVLKGLGLVLVAVVSGMLWWLIQQGGNSTSSSDTTGGTGAKPKTKYEFTKHEQVPEPVRDSNCANASYNGVKKFFEKNPCVQMTRELYTFTVDGRKGYTSVAVVRMRNAADAQELMRMTETDGTGNVNDLVRENRVKVPGLRNLSKDAGFANKIDGNDVIIVESDFENGKKDVDEDKLDEISKDALIKAEEIKN